MKHALVSILGVSLLAACTAGPDYHVPKGAMANAAAANGAFVSGHDPAFDQAALPDHWWRLYNDSRLDGYVHEALTANTDLRAADANLLRASAVVREVTAGRTVQTKITAGAYAARVGGYTLTVPLDLPYSAVAGVAIEYRSTWPAASGAASRRRRIIARPSRRRAIRCG